VVNSVLQGKKVLVVEDESLVAMLIEDMLLDFGARVEVAMRLPEALGLVEQGDFDLAILDVNLGYGQRSDAVAAGLRARRIPFLFATGYGERGVPDSYRGTPTVQKPYKQRELVLAIVRALADAQAKAGIEGSDDSGDAASM
jgi:CheY-like chemotaxis protein